MPPVLAVLIGLALALPGYGAVAFLLGRSVGSGSIETFRDMVPLLVLGLVVGTVGAYILIGGIRGRDRRG